MYGIGLCGSGGDAVFSSAEFEIIGRGSDLVIKGVGELVSPVR